MRPGCEIDERSVRLQHLWPPYPSGTRVAGKQTLWLSVTLVAVVTLMNDLEREPLSQNEPNHELHEACFQHLC